MNTEDIRGIVRAIEKIAFKRVREYFDQNYEYRESKFAKSMSNKVQLGCRVYVRSKSQNKYYGPFRVIDIEEDYVKISGILSRKIYGIRNDTYTIRNEDTLTRADHNSVRRAFPKLGDDIFPDDMEEKKRR